MLRNGFYLVILAQIIGFLSYTGLPFLVLYSAPIAAACQAIGFALMIWGAAERLAPATNKT